MRLVSTLLLTSTMFTEQLPNILWITSEDNGPHLGCYGDTYSVSPNIDALAAAIQAGMRVDEVAQLDLAYTPALGALWNPVLIAMNALLRKMS